MDTESNNNSDEPTPLDIREAFLQAVEKRTGDATHRRLLQACRSHDLSSALEGELAKVVMEILHEA